MSDKVIAMQKQIKENLGESILTNQLYVDGINRIVEMFISEDLDAKGWEFFEIPHEQEYLFIVIFCNRELKAEFGVIVDKNEEKTITPIYYAKLDDSTACMKEVKTIAEAIENDLKYGF